MIIVLLVVVVLVVAAGCAIGWAVAGLDEEEKDCE